MRMAALLLCFALTGAACWRRPSVAVIGLASSTPFHIRVARDQINSSGEPARVEILLADRIDVLRAQDGIALEVGRAAYLVKVPGLVGVVGHLDSRSSLIAAPIYNEARIPQLVPTATSSQLKSAGPWTFVLAPGDNLEGQFIGDFAVDRLGARSAAIFYQLDEYGRGLRDGVLAALSKRGVKVIDQTPFDWLHTGFGGPPEFDFESLVAASLKRGVPDVVIIAGRSREAAEIVHLLHAREPGVRFVTADGVIAEPVFLTRVGRAVNLCFLVAFWDSSSNSEISRVYLERFRRINGINPTPGDAISHDAIMLLVNAVSAAGPDPEAVRRYLSEIGSTRPAYHGVTGTISFARDRKPRLHMTQVDNGVTVSVATN